MSTAAADRESVVARAIREISHIATLPEITLRVVELVQDPRSTAQDLHRVISNDPALCSRILKVVNSSFYGLPGQIGSINRAIVMLGLNAVKNIAIAASLAKLFRGGQLTPTFSARQLWRHSVVTAAASKLLCDRLGLSFGDEAFLAGLIHDIGIMIEVQYNRTRLVEVLHQTGADGEGTPANDMLKLEESAFGANHQHFGEGLCRHWKFPASLAAATGHHHSPMDLPADVRTLPALVHLADRLAADIPGGFRLDLLSTRCDPEVLEFLNLSPAVAVSVRVELPEHLKTIESLLA